MTLRRFAYLSREWFHTYVWKKEKRALTPFGFELISRSYTSNRQMLAGNFEKEEVSVVQEILKSSDIFVDIGANIGFYSCLALQMRKRVIAVEPKRSNVDVLCRNLAINKWTNGECLVHPFALADKCGLLDIYGATGTAASLIKGWAGHSEIYSEVVPITTLDLILGDVIKSNSIFVKIDVEGAEHFVLSGARNTLDYKGDITWLIEICLDEYHPTYSNPKYKATFDLMRSYGYTAYTADSRRILVTEEDINSWVAKNKSDLNVINFLFIKGNNQKS